ncbi:MAG TPA: hypothetical protein VK141_06110 [Nitrosomonas sp.]|nr:hypothetical protein [Nitrosomonas sp.]
MAMHLFLSRDKLDYYKESLAKLRKLKKNDDARVELHADCPTS